MGVDVFYFIWRVFCLTVFPFAAGLYAVQKNRSFFGWGALSFLWALFPVLGLIPVPFIYLMMNGSPKGDESSPAAKQFAQGAAYVYLHAGTGIAVDAERQIVRLKGNRAVKEYPFSDVRGWETNLLSGGELIGNNVATAYGGIFHNIRIQKENKKGSGLFIDVADIGCPRWRIEMLRPDVQRRWMEILQQTINEGRL